MWNAVQLLEQGVFVPWERARAEAPAEPKPVTRMFQRSTLRTTPVPYQACHPVTYVISGMSYGMCQT